MMIILPWNDNMNTNISSFKPAYSFCSVLRQETSSAKLKKKHRIPSVVWDWIKKPGWLIYFKCLRKAVGKLHNPFSVLFGHLQRKKWLLHAAVFLQNQGLCTPCLQRCYGVGLSRVFLRTASSESVQGSLFYHNSWSKNEKWWIILCISECFFDLTWLNLFMWRIVLFHLIFLDFSGFLPTQRNLVLRKPLLFFAYLTACKLEVSSYCSKLLTVVMSLRDSWVSMYPSSMAALHMLVRPEVAVYP